MNIVLFEADELDAPLPRSDPRARHILDFLRRQPGDVFDAGVIDGPRGKGTLLSLNEDAIELSFTWGETPPALDPITLVIGLPRPQTARKILQEATSLGVCAMHFVTTERGERGYAQSTLWTSGEWRRHLIAGAQQAFDTRLPEITYGRSIADLLSALPVEGPRFALDNYEAGFSIGSAAFNLPLVLAFGPERGWSPAERGLLRANRFELVHLGLRVLRVETACVAAIALAKTELHLM